MTLDRPLDIAKPATYTLMYFLDYYAWEDDDISRAEFSESDKLAIHQLEEACKNSALLILFAHFERTETITRIPREYPNDGYWHDRNDDEEPEYDGEEEEHLVRLSRFRDSEGFGPYDGLEISLDPYDFNYIQNVHGLFEGETPDEEVEEDGQKIKTFNRTVRIVSISTSHY
jgi:hypothetical protein